MQIFVKIGDSDHIITLELEPNDPVAQLKLEILDRQSIVPDQQRLVFEGKQLDDPDRTLADYNIQRGSTIHVFIRTRRDI